MFPMDFVWFYEGFLVSLVSVSIVFSCLVLKKQNKNLFSASGSKAWSLASSSASLCFREAMCQSPPCEVLVDLRNSSDLMMFWSENVVCLPFLRAC